MIVVWYWQFGIDARLVGNQITSVECLLNAVEAWLKAAAACLMFCREENSQSFAMMASCQASRMEIIMSCL